MTPAPEPDAHHQLDQLHAMYVDLPPRVVRWRTQAGQKFLVALDDAVAAHGIRPVASALGVTTQAIYLMRDHTVNRQARPWPTQEDLRDLRAALRTVASAASRQYSVGRTSTEYRQIHEALIPLLERFAIGDLATALGIRTRQLSRFTDPPLPPPAKG